MTKNHVKGPWYFDQQELLIRRRQRQLAKQVLLWLFSMAAAFGFGLALASL